VSIARQLREQKICYLTLVSETSLLIHITFPKFLLTPFTVHEILEFEILSSGKHVYHEEISEILFRPEFVQRFRPVTPLADAGSRINFRTTFPDSHF